MPENQLITWKQIKDQAFVFAVDSLSQHSQMEKGSFSL